MTTLRRDLFEKLNSTLFQTLQAASAESRAHQHTYIELAHWLQQLLLQKDNDLIHIVRQFDLDITLIHQQLIHTIAQLPHHQQAPADFSPLIDIAIERSWMYLSLHTNDNAIRSAHLFITLLTVPELSRHLKRIAPALAKITYEDLINHLEPIMLCSDEMSDHTDTAEETSIPTHHENKNPLNRYCTDLTALAKNKQLDPVLGRDKEIRMMIDILLRRRQNNPLLTGDAGVGKTAIVEGLAQAIVSNQVPPVLQQVRLLSLDMGALLAGASAKGEFEARLKSLLDAAQKANPAVILFIDEVHTLVGAGGQEGTGDAANLLKPLLARGALKTIGATTWREYKRYIAKDPALTRRFQPVQVLEPEEIAAIHMIRGLAQTLASHHQVYLTDEAICQAVQLSHRYIPERQLPDKAISLLDTACARVAMSFHTPPAIIQQLQADIANSQTELGLLNDEIIIGKNHQARIDVIHQTITEHQAQLATNQMQWQQECDLAKRIISLRLAYPDAVQEQKQTITTELGALSQQQEKSQFVHTQVDANTVADIVSQWTGIPVGRLMHDRLTQLPKLTEQLSQRVIGQTAALARISEHLQTSHAQLTDPNKPMGVFLLTGPSGVGKTETALALADALYGGEQHVITINMSEFQETHTASTLKGSPPGYVGYGEGGVLTEAVRRRPYSVILLDEIEKAHPDVWELFYQVFDKGWMVDGEGRHINFKNTIILLTSNACADLITQLCDDIMPSSDQLEKLLLSKLPAVFPKAFLGRLNIIPYFPLKDDQLAAILRLHIDKATQRMQQHHGITVTYSDAVISHIINQCDIQETGVRHFIQFIERHVLTALSAHWITALTNKQTIASIHIDVNDAALIYQVHSL